MTFVASEVVHAFGVSNPRGKHIMARVYNRVGRALMPTSFAWRTDARFAGTKHRMNEFIIEFESADDRFPSGSRVTFSVCNRVKVLFGVAGGGRGGFL